MGFVRLKEILPGALEGLGITERLHQDRIERAWPAIAGTVSRELAASSSVVMLRDGQLTIRVPHVRLARLVAARQAELVAALQATAGAGVVRQIIPTLARS
jgi:predicted nucleic acid-binding Zn ribbon protein